MATSTALPLTPARRGWLAIGVPVCLVLIASTGLSLAATLGRGSFPVNYTFPAGTAKTAITISGGQVLVRQQAAGPARVTGTAHYSIVRAHISSGPAPGGGTRYNYDCVFPFGNCDLDATLTVPPGRAVSASTDGGNATVTGTTGAVTVSTGGGDITAEQVSGPLTLRTDGGNIRGTAVTAASLAASSGGGDITITFTTAPRDVKVSTDGGDITLILPPGSAAYDVTAHTDGGTVTDPIPQNPSSRDVITATSGGGNITIIRSTQ